MTSDQAQRKSEGPIADHSFHEEAPSLPPSWYLARLSKLHSLIQILAYQLVLIY